MPAVHIRNLPSEALSALKRRAARHERSLQKELRQILVEIAREELERAPLPPLELHLAEAGGESTWSRTEIYGDDGR